MTDIEKKINKGAFITVKISACKFSYDVVRFEDVSFGNVVAV